MPTNFSELHVLLIDDDSFMQNIAVRLLGDIGIKQTTKAGDGAKGFDDLMQANDPVDLVICDLEMPEMDGFQFVEKVRKEGGEYADVPILILTGNSDMNSIKSAASLGINGYLIKPISKTDLEKNIESALADGPTGSN